MKRILVLLTAAVGIFPAVNAKDVKSPDGRTVLNTYVKDGVPCYTVTYDGRTLLEESPLGLKTNVCDFSGNVIAVSDTISPYSVKFNQNRIKSSIVEFDANRLLTNYSVGEGHPFSIEWLVGNNDIAFRYLLPRQNKKGETGSMVVENETTGFRFPENTTTFITSQSDPMIGWKRTKPSYEEYYTNDGKMTDSSAYGRGYTFPALFHVGDNDWVLLSETGVDASYCGSRLGEFKDGVYSIEYPMPEENNGNGSASPGIALPGATPWRTITLGNSLNPIVETVIPWAPLEPLYNAKSSSGKGTWSWIIWQDNSINYDDQVKFIDLAADMGYEHVLIDAGWDVNIGRDGIRKLVDYARSKGVKIALWYSSSGWWNDIVQSPTDIMSRTIPRKKEMKWLKDLGVETIKVDFFGGDKQETMRLYEDILSDAADYGISVIFHGCTLPRGWERLYPNYVGSEAVLASENLVFEQPFCDKEAYHATLHPFIRNTVGSMEYGGSVFNKRLGRGDDRGNIRRTTDVFQMATAVLFQNPVQNFALTPEAFVSAPQEAINFMKVVPTEWDETRLIDGYPGKFVVLARRSADKWYVAAVNAEKSELKINIDLPMLAGKMVKIYNDKKDRSLTTMDKKIPDSGSLSLTLQPEGASVIVLE